MHLVLITILKAVKESDQHNVHQHANFLVKLFITIFLTKMVLVAMETKKPGVFNTCTICYLHSNKDHKLKQKLPLYFIDFYRLIHFKIPLMVYKDETFFISFVYKILSCFVSGYD